MKLDVNLWVMYLPIDLVLTVEDFDYAWLCWIEFGGLFMGV